MAKGESKFTQEPDFIAGLALEAVPRIAATLTKLLTPRGIKGCHHLGVLPSTPSVEHSNPPLRCELGDVLIAHAHRENGQVPVRNALLLQAKVTSGHSVYAIPAADHSSA